MEGGSVGRSGAAGRALALAFGVLVAFALAEGVLRLLDVPPSRPFFQEFYGRGFKLMAYDEDPSGAQDLDLRDPRTFAFYRARLGPAFARHGQETPHAVEVRTNSLGLRDRELTPPDGAYRIAVIGDSFTYGHGLPEAATYPRRLEALLRERHPDRRIEVLNAGSGGDDLPRIAQVADVVLARWRPDVLVYGYFLNDPYDGSGYDDAVHPMMDAAWLAPGSGEGHFRLGGLGEGPRSWQLLRRAWAGRRVTERTLAWYRALHEPERWAPAGRAIAAMAEQARASGARFVLIVLPLIHGLDGTYPLEAVHEDVVEACRSRGIEGIDALPVLRGRPDASLYLHPRDRHPNPRYAGLVAERLAQSLAP